jgi:hypothetical protein
MSFVRTLSLLVGLMLGLCFMPGEAHAKGFVLVNTGEDIFEAGPVPEEFFSSLPADEQPVARQTLAGWGAGYKCSIIGAFWIYVYMWDCKAVAFKDDTFDDSPEVVAAIDASYKGKYNVGFWKGKMRWVLAALAVAVGAIVVFGAIKGTGGSTEEKSEA